MATVTTVTPTVTTRPHIPGSPGDRSLAGEVDLATRESWSYVSSFVVGGLELTYNSGGPTVDIAQGRIARARPDADPSQELITVGAVSGVSLASSSVNYVYFKSDNDIEVRDADNPPSADAILIGTVDTGTGSVTEAVRGRSPISQFAAVGATSSGGSTAGGGGGGAFSRSDLDPRPLSQISLRNSDTAAVATDGDYAYFYDKGDLNGNGSDQDLLVIYDISSPSSPTLVSETDIGNFMSDIAVSGDYVYFANEIDSLFIYDISNKSSPTQTAQQSGFGNTIGVAVDDSGNYAYVADDLSIRAIDVSNKSSPAPTDFVGGFNNDFMFLAGIAYHDGLIYAMPSSFDSEFDSVAVIDASDKNQLRPVAKTDRSQALSVATAHDVAFDGDTNIFIHGAGIEGYYLTRVNLDTLADDASSGVGGLSDLDLRQVTRTSNTADISANAGEALQITNTAGARITVNLPAQPPDKTLVFVTNDEGSSDDISVGGSGGDTFVGASFPLRAKPSDGYFCQYHAADNDWFAVGGV